jgi:ABC-type multidrug transport system fused ATPase/permease subunit
MNILEYFAFIENKFFLNFIVIFFTIGIYPFINFMTPLYLICLEGLKIFISWTLALYLFSNLRYALRITYFIKNNEKELKLLEQNEIEEINNDNIELEENEIKDIETKEINNNESELEENEIKEIEIKDNDMKENLSWVDCSIEKLE